MRAMLIDRVGHSDALRLADVPKPEPGPGDVLIRVACAGVNPADWKCREGYLGAFMQYTFPFVIGFDVAGVVEAVGAGVDGFAPGMRVFAQTDVGAGKWGAYAEYTAVRHDSVVRLPDTLGFAEAATVPTPALAAWTGLFDDGGLQPGQKVLVHGGAGAVGTFAIQFAARAGAEVAATCSAANRPFVESLGCAHSIDYRAQDVHDTVRGWAPGGVDLVLDAVGGGTLPRALDLLAPGGTLANIMTLVAEDVERLATIASEAARRGLRTAMTFSRMPSGERLGRIAAQLADGRVRVPRFERLPLEQAARALDLVQSGDAKTKLVLHVADIAG
ncbi:NADP-dependent oxidoreductase [Burkholderia sp. Ac-20353]|uniref:NADP-dependent oxidoreductase n=1 Tax=Burkholderia sp. Ac-20353 TaxID=2703894 RepID=UPI00197C1C7C|nr:NADP-dependent oxidoreductase [Burkholderia sp. Ac-20353]MBN3790379.1 NADP-dependent oxidoreductase [Burkholderia sp. Ac-20353]